MIGVSLAVAAVPEGLATILTIVMALGVQRMARRNAIIRRLSAVETLGAATTICTDKTGTLTRNEMTVRRIVTPSGSAVFSGTGYRPAGDVTDAAGEPLASGRHDDEVRGVLRAAVLASNASVEEVDGAWQVHGDPTEGALITAAAKLGEAPDLRRVDEVPFSSSRKLMSTVHEVADRAGAAPRLHEGCPRRAARAMHARTARRRGRGAHRHAAPGDRGDRRAPRGRGDAHASRWVSGGSTPRIGVGEHLERELVFLGVVGMIDPPREEATAAVAEAQGAGVRMVMITGDHPVTARAIAQEVGIARADDHVVTGVDLDRMDERELDATVVSASVYARVSPEHKLWIVRALQRQAARSWR